MDLVTGAFSYTGRAIAEELLRRGREVRTLTRRHEGGDPLAGRIDEAPLQFQDPAALRRALDNVVTLYNTYWIRYARGATTFERAVANTRVLLEAAADAGIKRVVHVSVTNPRLDSPLPYFRGKAQVEADVAASTLSYAIVRPTLVFGANDILLNNIAWGLRRYGYKEEAATIAAGILDAAEFFDGRLPEAFGGYERSQTKYPVQYPTACSPQAWSTGAPLLLISTMLGLQPIGDHLVVDPALPVGIGHLELLDIPGRWGRVDAFGRGRVEVKKRQRLRPELGSPAPAKRTRARR